MSKKATTKTPFLPFFVGDFFAATQEWEGEAVSIYATLLLHQWAAGSIPSDPKRICKLIKWDWEVFQVHWRVVRRKFASIIVTMPDGEEEERLINDRLEAHRDKTVELSKKNAANGQKGAQTRWGNDSDRHPKDMANATEKNGERHAGNMANAKHVDSDRHPSNPKADTGDKTNDDASDSDRHPKTMANAIKKDGIPSHPIPSHPIPSDPSTQVDVSSGSERLHVGSDENSSDEVEFDLAGEKPRERGAKSVPPEFLAFKAAYPRRAGDQGWAEALRRCNARLKEGFTWQQIIDGAKRYAEHVRATESEGTQYVKQAAVFVGTAGSSDGTERHFLKPWEIPPSRNQQRQDANLDASAEWLRQSETNDAKH